MPEYKKSITSTLAETTAHNKKWRKFDCRSLSGPKEIRAQQFFEMHYRLTLETATLTQIA